MGTLTELDASGNPTGTPYVGTITNTSTFANPPSNVLFTATQQCPSFKNYNTAAGNADNATFTITPPAPQPPTAAEYVIVISVDGLGGTYLSKLFDGTATGGPYAIPNFTRLKNEGAGTLAAHMRQQQLGDLAQPYVDHHGPAEGRRRRPQLDQQRRSRRRANDSLQQGLLRGRRLRRGPR